MHYAQSPQPQTTDRALSESISAAFRDPLFEAPMLPAVAVELVRVTDQPNVHVDKVVTILENDALLAGKLLKLVNSPLYRGRAPIRSLRQAIIRLGISRIRNLFLQVAMGMRVVENVEAFFAGNTPRDKLV